MRYDLARMGAASGLIVSFAGISSTSPAHNPHRHSNIIPSGFSETTDCVGWLSHFRDDFGCWNFLYLKNARILQSGMPHQARSKNSTGYRHAVIVFFRDNQEA
jgi:hypothetical protein